MVVYKKILSVRVQTLQICKGNAVDVIDVCVCVRPVPTCPGAQCLSLSVCPKIGFSPL